MNLRSEKRWLRCQLKAVFSSTCRCLRSFSAHPALETTYKYSGVLLMIKSSMMPPLSVVNRESDPVLSGSPWISATTNPSRNFTLSFPCTFNCNMWDTSKRDASCRVWRCDGKTPSLYWTGMDQPQKGTILPPSSKWKSCNAVFFRSSWEWQVNSHCHESKIFISVTLLLLYNSNYYIYICTN